MIEDALSQILSQAIKIDGPDVIIEYHDMSFGEERSQDGYETIIK